MASERTVSCPECGAERQTRANSGVRLTCSNGHQYRAPAPPAAPEPAAGGGVPVKRAAKVKIRQQARPNSQDASGGVADKTRPTPSGPPAGPDPAPPPPATVGDPAPEPAAAGDQSPPPAPEPPPVDNPPPPAAEQQGQHHGRKGGYGRYRELVRGRHR